jgi:hypothetical protein
VAVKSPKQKEAQKTTEKKARMVLAPLPADIRMQSDIPIAHWSHSSLMSYLRNPLAWYKRYVENIRDTPSNPSAIIGRSAHVALQHFYGGIAKEGAVELGLSYLRSVPDFEIQFGTAISKKARAQKRVLMEREYLQAISFYLDRPPRHRVVGVEVSGMARVPGVQIPVKAISDLVVVSREDSEALDIVDHKFVDSFSKHKAHKTLFVVQALFNYYTVLELYGKPVRRFIVYECKKRKNKDGGAQRKKYVIRFSDHPDIFTVFQRLLREATHEISRTRHFLPNPSDMFEGEDSFDLYRMGLVSNEKRAD